jgi:hypothetical protein
MSITTQCANLFVNNYGKKYHVMWCSFTMSRDFVLSCIDIQFGRVLCICSTATTLSLHPHLLSFHHLLLLHNPQYDWF